MSNDMLGEVSRFIKLLGGKQINLDTLDSLVNKQDVNSIFLEWEAKNENCDHNSIFSQKEVDILKQQIYEKYCDDNNLSQNDIDNLFGKNENGESKVSSGLFENILNSLISKSDEKAEELQPEQNESNQQPVQENENETETEEDSKVYTDYTVQPGDTPAKIAQKLGLKGEEAKAFTENLTQRLKANGQLKKWLMVGDVIKLSGDYSQKIAEMSDYTTDKKELENRYKETRKSVEIKGSDKPSLPSGVQKKIDELKAKNAKTEFYQDKDGSYIIKKLSNFENPQITSVTFTYNKSGTFTKQITTYKNGDIRTHEYDASGKQIKQTLEKNDGSVYVGTPDNNGNIKSLRQTQKPYPASILNKIKELEGKNSTVTVNRTHDGFEITEKNSNLNKTGYTRIVYKYDKNGKLTKVIRFKTPKQNTKPSVIPKPFWGNDNDTNFPMKDFSGNPTENPPVDSDQNSKSNNKVTPKKPENHLSQAHLIPGLERIASNPLKPRSDKDFARFLHPTEMSYPEKMRACIAELRAAGIECKIQYQDDNGNYIALLDDSNYTLLGYQQNRFGKTVIVFDKNGNLKESKRNEFGIGMDTVTEYQNGKAVSKKMEKSVPLKTVNNHTGVPYAVEREFERLKLNAKSSEVVKNNDNTFSLVCVPSDAINKTGALSKIEYRYDWDGKFLYQLNFSSENESVQIGRINSNTKNIEFKEFKDENGIIANIPDKVMQKYNEMRQGGGIVTIEKDKDVITITQTKSQYMDTNHISKIVHKFDAFGKLLTQDYTLSNGRVVNYYDASTKGNDPAHIPNPIKIKLPPQYLGVDEDSDQMVYGLNTKGPKDTAQRFAKQIENDKSGLMTQLKMTNEEYDNLAILAMGIAEQELHFGQKEYLDTHGGTHSQSGLGSRANAKYYYNKFSSDESRASHSQGITQIRFNSAIKEPIIKKRLANNGIKTFDDLKSSVEKQATATMIILNQYRIIAESPLWQERLAKNNKLVEEKYPNGFKDPATGKFYSKDDLKLTTNDIIVMLWNGAGGVTERIKRGEVITILTGKTTIKTGKIVTKIVGTSSAGGPVYANIEETKDLKGCNYAKNIRAYASAFFATPETDSPGYMHTAGHAYDAGTVGADSQRNNGELGVVIFMPKSYSSNERASQKDITNLKNALNKLIENEKDATSKEELINLASNLISAVENGELSFGYSLTEEEAASISKNDIKLLLDNLKELKANIEGKKPKEIRNLAKATRDHFHSQYLESRQFIIKDSDAPQGSILYAQRYNENIDEKLDNNRKSNVTKAHLNGKKQGRADAVASSEAAAESAGYRYGFMVEKDKGVNPYDSTGNLIPDKQRELAEYGSIVSRDMGTGGSCLTGVKLALENTGIVQKGDIVYPTGHPKAGLPIKDAKDLRLFLDSHPEKFQKVKYISIGNGQSRELNASDIKNLPAGYIGIFIPGPGYDNQSGHAFITNGNGQGYSDEVDNLRWDDFKSGGSGNGKGEHGKFVIYKIKI